MVEDDIVVTPSGHEVMSTLEGALRSLSLCSLSVATLLVPSLRFALGHRALAGGSSGSGRLLVALPACRRALVVDQVRVGTMVDLTLRISRALSIASPMPCSVNAKRVCISDHG